MTERKDEMGTQDDQNGLRTRVNALEHSNTLHEQRVSALENWRTDRNIYDARREEQMTSFKRDIDKDMQALKDDIKDVGDEVGEVKGVLKWMNKAMIGAIIIAVVGFALKGGLVIPPI